VNFAPPQACFCFGFTLRLSFLNAQQLLFFSPIVDLRNPLLSEVFFFLRRCRLDFFFFFSLFVPPYRVSLPPPFLPIPVEIPDYSGPLWTFPSSFVKLIPFSPLSEKNVTRTQFYVPWFPVSFSPCGCDPASSSVFFVESFALLPSSPDVRRAPTIESFGKFVIWVPHESKTALFDSFSFLDKPHHLPPFCRQNTFNHQSSLLPSPSFAPKNVFYPPPPAYSLSYARSKPRCIL